MITRNRNETYPLASLGTLEPSPRSLISVLDNLDNRNPEVSNVLLSMRGLNDVPHHRYAQGIASLDSGIPHTNFSSILIRDRYEPTERILAGEAKNSALTTIRQTVRALPKERHSEIFDDFESAVKLRDIGYLADTISNWALGGHGYDYAGTVVNHLEPLIPIDADEETLAIWDSLLPSDDNQ